MAEFLTLAENGGARYEARSGMLVACPFCGDEFGYDVLDAMRDADEKVYCPNCGTPIYRDQFYVPEAFAYSY